MAQTVKVWYDREGDFLEVLFSNKPGFMRETDNDAVMERVDEQGHILGSPSCGSVASKSKNRSLPNWCREAAECRGGHDGVGAGD